MIQARPYKAEDYAMVSAWWGSHGWPSVPAEFLPVVGIIIEDEGVPRCAVWIKQENSTPIAMMEWLVTNPDNTGKQSMRVISHAVASCRDCCKAMGRTALFTYCKQPSLSRIYQREGFELSDEGMIHLLMKL